MRKGAQLAGDLGERNPSGTKHALKGRNEATTGGTSGGGVEPQRAPAEIQPHLQEIEGQLPLPGVATGADGAVAGRPLPQAPPRNLQKMDGTWFRPPKARV